MNWKGNKVGYEAIHWWIKKRKSKPKICQICHKKKNEYKNSKLVLANISGIYKRDLNDWIYCHQSCHIQEHKKGNHKNIKHRKYVKKRAKIRNKKQIRIYKKEWFIKNKKVIMNKRKNNPQIKIYQKRYRENKLNKFHYQ